MSEHLDTTQLTPEMSVAHFYDYADAVRRSVAWLMKDDLEEISEYGNELIGNAADEYGREIGVYMDFDTSVFEEVEDAVEPVLRESGRTNTVGMLNDFFVEEQDDGDHKLYARIVSTAVGIEGQYRKLIASVGDREILGDTSVSNEMQNEGDEHKLSDMYFDVSRRSSRMTEWRFRQTRELETMLQDEWCIEAQDLWRYISMKTVNMRDEQMREYQVALNLYLEEAYRNGLSVKARFTESEVVTQTELTATGANNGAPRLARVGDEASLIAITLSKHGKETDVACCLEDLQDRDQLYELDITSARGVVFGTLDNLRRT